MRAPPWLAITGLLCGSFLAGRQSRGFDQAGLLPQREPARHSPPTATTTSTVEPTTTSTVEPTPPARLLPARLNSSAFATAKRGGGPTHKDAPQVSTEMSLALRRTGIQLRESFVWSSPAPRRNSSSKRIVTVVPGLARLCGHRQWMEEMFTTLERSNLVFLLQSGEDRVFDACLRTIRLLTDTSTSSVVVGRQWLATRPNGLPCNLTSASETRGTFPRVQMQTFAVGRAYEWALHFFPKSEFVARVRLDASSCLPSDDELSRFPADRPVLVTNDFDVSTRGGSEVYSISDRYAFVPVALAASYFEAWRVWSRVRCDRPCYAGLHSEHAVFHQWHGVGNGKCGANVTDNVINGCGETPLTLWLGASKQRHHLARAPATGDPIIRQNNKTHAVLQGSEADVLPITRLVGFLRDLRHRRTTCVELPQQKGWSTRPPVSRVHTQHPR